MCVDKELDLHLQFHHGSNWNQPLLILKKNKKKPMWFLETHTYVDTFT